MTLKEVNEIDSHQVFWLPQRGDGVNLVVNNIQIGTGKIEVSPVGML
jgi:hypothetical protein